MWIWKSLCANNKSNWPETCWVSDCLCVWSMCQPTRMSTVSFESSKHHWLIPIPCNLTLINQCVQRYRSLLKHSPWSWCWRHVGSSEPPEVYTLHFDKAVLVYLHSPGWTAGCSWPAETHNIHSQRDKPPIRWLPGTRQYTLLILYYHNGFGEILLVLLIW